MTNDFLKLKQKNKKVDEIRHFDDDPKRLPNGRFTFKDNNVIDAEVVSETKKNPKLSKEQKATAAKGGAGVLKGIKDLSDSSAKLFDKDKKENKEYNKYPEMTDKELSEKLNRLRMEQQYSDLHGDTKITKTGSEKAKDALQTIGAVAGIGASVLGIFYAIYQIKNGQKPSGN